MNLKDYIANVSDFPIEGIQFKDITPLIGDGKAFQYATNLFVEFTKEVGADIIVGPDARGFIFGCPVATQLGMGFVPVRKPNKLPREVISYSYDLEYGKNELCMHNDAVKKGDRVRYHQIIGRVGATGRVTGPHLHWTVYFDGNKINPESLLKDSYLSSLLQVAIN